MCILPVNIDGIRYATAQPIAKRDGKIYLAQVKGIPSTIALQNGKVLKNLKPSGTAKPVCQNIYLLTSEQAERLFLQADEPQARPTAVAYQKEKEAGALRTITIGVNRVAEEPTDEDFEQAAVYTIHLPQQRQALLQIAYRGEDCGDCQRVAPVWNCASCHYKRICLSISRVRQIPPLENLS